LKFLLPFSLLVAAGSLLERRSENPPVAPATVERISTAFAPAPIFVSPVESSAEGSLWLAIWALGTICVAGRWMRQWNRLRAIERAAQPLAIDLPVRALVTSAPVEPGIFGVLRPVLLLPEGLTRTLTPAQFQTIIAHELCHVRRRDNLTGALHMAVAALFWFHPLVWWIGARLVEERERACDEGVIERGGIRDDYAQGILNVCKLYLASPLPCAAGVSGADLRKRITAIMTHPLPRSLSLSGRVLIGALGLAALTMPVLVGALRAPSPGEIRRGTPGFHRIQIDDAGFHARNMSLAQLIQFAYGVQGYQITGGPDWVHGERFDIAAQYPDVRRMGNAGIRAAVRELLSERFQLRLREETREVSVYILAADTNGHKLAATTTGNGSVKIYRADGSGSLRVDGVPLKTVAGVMSEVLGRPVMDRTGMNGLYELDLQWSGGVDSMLTAVREQFGLRLDPANAAVASYVIERAEKPPKS
jgi:uncharacterized protein (TIGR03435 family)